MEVPEEDTESFVVLQKVGSTKVNHICSANMAIQSYGPSLLLAALLNEEVKEVIEESIELSEISAVRLNSDYEYTDTATKRYRYQCVYVVTHLA